MFVANLRLQESEMLRYVAFSEEGTGVRNLMVLVSIGAAVWRT